MRATDPVHYLDTSALVKLVVEEHESPALYEWLQSARRKIVTSDLSRTELLRAVRRVSPLHATAARTLLRACGTLSITTDICERAALLDPTGIRSLDAIHLATALTLGDDLRSFVCYDIRLQRAAVLNGMPLLAPS